MSDRFFTLDVGARVRWKNQLYDLTRHAGSNKLLLKHPSTGEMQLVAADEVMPEEATKELGSGKRHRDLRDYSDAEFTLARERFSIIEPLLASGFPGRRGVDAVAMRIGKDFSTIYRWLRLYRSTGRVTSLIPNRRGPRIGSRRLSEEQEKILAKAIDEFYLTKQRLCLSRIVDEVIRNCRLAQIEPPCHMTVRRRVHQLPVQEVLMRRGHLDRARDRYTLIERSYDDAKAPLDIVQIDHTPADIIVVDEQHRLPLSRPWLTVAMDLYSRMVVGFYLSFDAPSSISVGMCLSQAICQKRDYLAKLGVEGDWPVWGTMGIVHADNGVEFKGSALQRSAVEYNIDLQSRPIGKKHYGGHIERMLQTINGHIRELPGATFSNPQERKGYDSVEKARLTLTELERRLAGFIVNTYHQEPHSSLGISPLQKWQKGIFGDETTPGIGLRPAPKDPQQVFLDFLPSEERTIQTYGVRIDHFEYTDAVLAPFIHGPDSRKKRKFRICRDPRNLNNCWFLHPSTKEWIKLTPKDPSRPNISLAEFQAAQKRLAAKGHDKISEGLIVRDHNAKMSEIEKAENATKEARRTRERRARDAEKPTKLRPASRAAVAATSAPAATTPSADEEPIIDIAPSEYRL